MHDLWTGLGYKMFTPEGHINGPKFEDYLTEFISLIQDNKDEIKTCVAFIGSHGKFGKIDLSDKSEINVYDDFIYKLASLEALKGKPKFFIVQACHYFPRTRTDGALVMPFEDTMISFSTIPGTDSNLDEYLGGWYINCLTEVFMKNAYQMDLERMLIEVLSFY